MRFYYCSQNNCSISPITLRRLPLRSSSKTIIIWHSKQVKTLYNQWFGVALWNSLFEKKLNIHKKMPAVESCLYKTMGSQVEPFWFFQSSNPVERMRISKIIAFKITFFEKLVFPFQRSLTYKYTDAYNTLLSIP